METASIPGPGAVKQANERSQTIIIKAKVANSTSALLEPLGAVRTITGIFK